MDSVESRVKSIISELLHISEDQVSARASFATDLGIDSKDAVDLVIAVEKSFSIQISDEQAAGLQAVRDLVAFVRAQLNNESS